MHQEIVIQIKQIIRLTAIFQTNIKMFNHNFQ